jgi:hypothetical protein
MRSAAAFAAAWSLVCLLSPAVLAWELETVLSNRGARVITLAVDGVDPGAGPQAKRSTLGFYCEAQAPLDAILILGDRAVGIGPDLSVSYQFDDNPAVEAVWPARNGSAFITDPLEFMDSMEGQGRLTVTWGASSGPQVRRFDVSNIAVFREKLEGVCIPKG